MGENGESGTVTPHILAKYAAFTKRDCDTPIPGVPLTTRQPAKTCGYRVSRYHTHLSHVLRLITAYLIHKYTKIYDRLFNQQSFTVLYKTRHFIQNVTK